MGKFKSKFNNPLKKFNVTSYDLWALRLTLIAFWLIVLFWTVVIVGLIWKY